jgi:multiple sugar transport system substrate-binding protein
VQVLTWKYKVSPSPSNDSMSGLSFESGKIAMVWGWTGSTPDYRKNITSFEWDIAPVPSGPLGRVTMLSGNQLVMNKTSRNKKSAWEFMKCYVNPEMYISGKMRRCTPTRKSVANDPEYLKSDGSPRTTKMFVDAYNYGRLEPINEKYSVWEPEFMASIQLIKIKEYTPKQAVEWADKRINTILHTEDF